MMRNPMVWLLPLLLLTSCQQFRFGVMHNGTDEELLISFSHVRYTGEGGVVACRQDTQQDVPISLKPIRRLRGLHLGADHWGPAGKLDGETCGIRDIRLPPGHALIVERQPWCHDYEKQIRQNGGQISQYTPSIEQISVTSSMGVLELAGWKATERFRRMNDRFCVFEVRARDFRRQTPRS